jgi:hypothetical protein
VENARFQNWSGGANNLAPHGRLPEGNARRLLNLDPTSGGVAELRPQFELAFPFDNLRAMFALGDALVVVDGDQVKRLRASQAVAESLGQVAASGPVAAAELNGVLYMRTIGDRLAIDDAGLHQWGAESPAVSVSIGSGALPAGLYRVAATAVDGKGLEGGADVMTVRLAAGSSLTLTPAGSGEARIYCSVADGQQLYLQAVASSAVTISVVADDAEALVSEGMKPMPPVSMLAVMGSQLVGVDGRFIYVTEPYSPQLVDPVRGFVQFPDPVAMVAPVGPASLFVAYGEKTQFITGVGTGSINATDVCDFGAVAGSATELPDGTVAWFSRFGQVIGAADGSIRLVNQGKFAPDLAQQGAAAVLEHGGRQSIITTMRGPVQSNRLAVADSWILEVTDER